MHKQQDIALFASLLGDQTRASMVTLLMDGRAYTATELAAESEVTPSTASSHLAKLHEGGIVKVIRQGRFHYFSIADPEVAKVVEELTSIAQRVNTIKRKTGPSDPELRRARVCYDHLAGTAGVEFLDRIKELGFVIICDDNITVTPSGESWCERIGIDLSVLRNQRRKLCRSCLDWSERRPHLAGSLGAALLERVILQKLVHRLPCSRVLVVSPYGQRFIRHPELGF
jgi:DNA-binding transcriptional ArsR family regulator